MSISNPPDDTSSPRQPPSASGLVRSLNLEAVLQAILEEGELSRPAVAERTGLSLPTSISLIGELEDLGLVGKTGDTTGGFGRPAALYSLNDRAGYVFAVDLGARKVTACVSDLRGSVIVENTEPTRRGTAEGIIEQITELHRELIGRAGFAADAPGVTSIGIGGVVQPQRGLVTDVTNLPELEGTAFTSDVADAVGVPVFVENDVNLAAIGELSRGRARGLKNFVVISVGSGTGMGVVINGQIYRGSNGGAGEIALLPLRLLSATANGNDGGAFEGATSGSGILRIRDDALARAPKTTLSVNADVSDIFEAAYNNDAIALEIIDEEARTLALGVAAVSSILDPELVVLTGSIGSQELLADAISRHTAALLISPPEVVISSLGSRGTIFGALAVSFEAVHRQILQGPAKSANGRTG